MVREAARPQPVAAATARRLRATLDSFPGIAPATDDGEDNRAHVQDDGIALALRFDNGSEGKVALMVVDFIMSRMGKGRRLDGRAPIRPLPGRGHGETARTYVCSASQASTFERMLRYASPLPQGPQRPRMKLAASPLSVLLSHAFVAFERDYQATPCKQAKLSLGIWSNVLRAIPDDGLPRNALCKRTILSRRGAQAVLRDLERMGWLSVEQSARQRTLRPTAAGRRTRDAAPTLIRQVEASWRKRFGAETMRALREALATVVARCDVELPWCLTGYGLADASVTGGGHVPGRAGPPRIPQHGTDWPVVLREAGSNVSELPLSALLSQALAIFTIDYEWGVFGYGAGLNATSNLLQHIPDEGTTLGQASALGEVRGNGKAGLERHLVVVVEPGKAGDPNRRVWLTPKGRRARDSHAYLATQVERNWGERCGKACTATLRDALQEIDGELGEDLPNYPDTTAWFLHSMIAGGAAIRGASG